MSSQQKTRSSEVKIKGETWQLLPEKVVYWEKENTLILTDLHLGKAGHFRKAGIPIPSGVHHADLDCLSQLINQYQVNRVLMLGDLFHSELNREWLDFCEFLDLHRQIDFLLVKGNHDILPKEAYHEPNLQVYDHTLIISPFVFLHHPPEEKNTRSLYPVSGHIHPGYKVKIKAGQSIKLPCFFIGVEQAILPAFGKFTGCVALRKQKKDRVYAIFSDRNTSGVIQIKH